MSVHLGYWLDLPTSDLVSGNALALLGTGAWEQSLVKGIEEGSI